MMATQPRKQRMNQAGLLHRSQAHWSNGEKHKLQQQYQSCYEELQKLLDVADQQGKMAVTKEHTPFMMSPTTISDFLHGPDNNALPWSVTVPERYCSARSPSYLRPNCSVLPNEFLLQCTPVFLIRHPALAFPSYYRVILSFCDGNMAKVEQEMVPYIAIACTLRWTRQLYDWYTAAWAAEELKSEGPILLDSDSMLENPVLISQFCSLVGLDQEKVQFHWDALTKEQQKGVDDVGIKARASLHSSSGIMEGKTFKGLTIEGEAGKWRAEFGELVGTRIESWVRAAMPDYLYLVGKKLGVKAT
ncbi:hypothetical protein NQ176_g1887 [Zarea fungicola]|uniref:Uncharacterized protein n=1 Tax=Zarea fungicola TaxID=93591 RepID=A0ACC1NQR6_9HYPO|nr:hypothetical protein NQ176_g1887 [Lecanicillium fungicola]